MDCLIVYVKLEDSYTELARHIEKRFDTSNYEVDRPMLIGKNENVIEMMKDELGGKIMKSCSSKTVNVKLSHRL